MRSHSTGYIYNPVVVQEMQHRREAVETARGWTAEDEARTRHWAAEACCWEDEDEARRVEVEARFMADKAKEQDYRRQREAKERRKASVRSEAARGGGAGAADGAIPRQAASRADGCAARREGP